MSKKLIFIFSALIFQFMFVAMTISEEIKTTFNLEEPHARTIESGFPYDEAGISAYINIGSITGNEMNTALSVFSSMIESNSEYTLGLVSNIHTYIGFSGWIIAYLPKDKPVSTIIHPNKQAGGVSKFNTPISRICSAINKNFDQDTIKYYHFKYPEANEMIFIFERLSSKGTDSFYVELPSEFIFYEASYAIYQDSSTSIGTLLVDDIELAKLVSKGQLVTGYYDLENILKPDIAHKISITNADSYGCVDAETVIVYKK